MIHTIRTRLKRRTLGAVNLNLTKPKIEESAPRRGFFNGFFKMWEHQADLVVRNIHEDSKF